MAHSSRRVGFAGRRKFDKLVVLESSSGRVGKLDDGLSGRDASEDNTRQGPDEIFGLLYRRHAGGFGMESDTRWNVAGRGNVGSRKAHQGFISSYVADTADILEASSVTSDVRFSCHDRRPMHPSIAAWAWRNHNVYGVEQRRRVERAGCCQMMTVEYQSGWISKRQQARFPLPPPSGRR